MFEPVHGSAPDIAGQGIANPVGAIWSAAMMLDHLGQQEAATLVMGSLRNSLAAGVRSADMGGSASTSDVTASVVAGLRENASVPVPAAASEGGHNT